MPPSGKASLNYGTIQKFDPEIIYLHKMGYSYYKIAHSIKFDAGSVRDRCLQLGLVFKSQDKVENHLQEILQMRENKISIREIARKLNFSHPAVSALLKRHNQNTDKVRSTLDETFFEKIDTEEKAWCLGLWMSDGNLYEHTLNICMTDLDVIQKIKKAMNYSGEIYTIEPKNPKHKTKYRINIISKKLAKDIIKYGITPKKSLTLKFPSLELIPNNLINNLIRGIHDGDGCLAKYKTRNNWGIIFTGTLEVLQGIEKYSNIKGYYEYIGEDETNTWHWRIRKQSDIIKMLEWMYDGAAVYMDRKKLKADECLLDLRSRGEKS